MRTKKRDNKTAFSKREEDDEEEIIKQHFMRY